MKSYPPPVAFGTAFPDEKRDLEVAQSFAEVGVYFRKLKLQALSWADVYEETTKRTDLAYPDGGDADNLKWVQYKLNELGYVAGPITGTADDRTKRAIRRYTFATPGRAETDDPKDAQLVADLKAGLRPRNMFETPAAATDPAQASRVLIDHNYGFVNPQPVGDPYKGLGNANDPDGHVDRDKAKLDRFELPLRVVAELVSKTDAHGTGEGVPAPPIPGLKCEWVVLDPEEQLGVVKGSDGPEALRSKARQYLGAVQANLAGGTRPDDLQDNCPVDLGGFRPADAKDMTAYFAAADLDPLYTSAFTGKAFRTEFQTTDKVKKAFFGSAGALFRGSYVAGDNYVVAARIVLDGVAHADEIKAAHRKLPGLGDAFSTEVYAGDPLAARTGELTVWRRHKIEAVIDWGDFSALPPIDWNAVGELFAAAHVVLTPPVGGPRPITHFANSPQRTNAYLDRLMGSKVGKVPGPTGEPPKRPQLVFSADNMWPFTYPAKRQGEDSATYWNFTLNTKAKQAQWLSGGSVTLRDVSRWLREIVGVECGLLLVRAQYFPTAPAFNDGFVPEVKAGPSKGDDWGVAFLEKRHFTDYADAFLVAHELGHCFYLSHAADTAIDHDGADRNCVMYYPEQADPKGEHGWGRRGPAKAKPAFCGKCLLKLRGWKVRPDALPASSGEPVKPKPPPPSEPPKIEPDTALGPALALEGDKADLGRFPLNVETTAALKIRNTGDAPLHLDEVRRTKGNALTAAIGGMNPIPAGDEGMVLFKWKPTALGSVTETFEIDSDDRDGEAITVDVTATAVYPLAAAGSDGQKRAREIVLDLWQGKVPASLANERAVGARPPKALLDAMAQGPDAVHDLLRAAPSSVVKDGPVDNWGSGGTFLYEPTKEVSDWFRALFDATKTVNPAIELDLACLFHGHVFFCGPQGGNGPAGGELGVLFHAREYPSDTQPDQSDQGKAKFTSKDPSYIDRNILYLASLGKMWSIRPAVENEPMLLNIGNAQVLVSMGVPHPRVTHAIDNQHVYDLGKRLPDVNLLPDPLDSGPLKIFLKAYEAK